MPGITASSDGRVFVSFSRAIDPNVTLSVAELVDGKPQSFPPGLQQGDGAPAPDRLLSVQSLVVDSSDRLWMLDTGKVGMKPVEPGSVSWPDTLALLPDGRLLVTATQIQRSDRFRPKDERVKPFEVLSIAIGVKPRVGRNAPGR